MELRNSLGNTSYVFGYDNFSGWGDRYFFTYFSEFGDRSFASIAVEVTILCSIFIISILANIAIGWCVIRFPDMKTVTNCFVLNLAAADLLFACSIPPVAYTRVVGSWKFGDATCRLMPYTQFVSGIVLLWTLALISLDRHRCIVVPPYRSKITPTEASIFSGIIWALAAILFIPVAFWFREQVSSDGTKVFCTIVFPMSEAVNYSLCFMVPLVIFACLLPMVMLVYNYHRIFMKIISTKNTWATSCVVLSTMDVKGCNRAQVRRQSELSLSDIFTPWPRKCSSSSQFSCPSGRQGSLSHHEEIRLNKHIKVVRVLFLNVIMVLLMWLPITIVMFLIYFDGRRTNDDQNFFLKSQHFIIALIIAFFNTVINPVLYGVLSEPFRVCLAKLWCTKPESDRNTIIKEAATPSSGRNQGSYKISRKQSYINSVSESPNEVI